MSWLSHIGRGWLVGMVKARNSELFAVGLVKIVKINYTC